MSNFHLTDMALKMYCPGNEAIIDDAGLPSIMVWIPAFKNSDVLTGGDDSIHPAFIVNGVQIPGFWYSKYQNIVYKGKAFSLPAEDPQTTLPMGTALEYCEAKGYGWHLSTAAEWAAIALLCKKNGFLPYGNNSYKKDSRETEVKAIPVGSDGSRVATGTGPLTWSHDGTMSGIWDLNGNLNEWQGGLRLVWGELQILANNDAADPDNPQNETSTCWKAINATDGTLVDPECLVSDTACKTSGSTVKLDYVNNVWTFSTGISDADTNARNCAFASVTSTEEVGTAAKVLLRALALLPDEGATGDDYENDRFYAINAQNERGLCRGGYWELNAGAGVFSLYCNNPKSGYYAGVGFRASYIPNI